MKKQNTMAEETVTMSIERYMTLTKAIELLDKIVSEGKDIFVKRYSWNRMDSSGYNIILIGGSEKYEMVLSELKEEIDLLQGSLGDTKSAEDRLKKKINGNLICRLILGKQP